MKKALIILLCALAVFAIVSCKQEPKVETFKVTFDSQGGSAVAAAEVEKDAKVAEPADPSKMGAFFDGWFEDAECKKEYDFNTPVTKAITLYAKWKENRTIAKMTASKGIVDKKSSYEKFQFNIDLRDILGENGGVQSGDVLTLKFRTSRNIYDYDIRTNKKVKQAGADASIDVRWVYETFRGTLEDPILGEDGWYTMTYTFGDSYYASKTAPNYVTDQYYNIGLNFRGYLVAGDFIEIADVTYKRGETTYDIKMKSSYSAADWIQLDDAFADHRWVTPKTYVAMYYENSSDAYPKTEVVTPGDVVKGLTEVGFKFDYFSDKDKTTAFDLGSEIEKDTTIYYTKTAAE